MVIKGLKKIININFTFPCQGLLAGIKYRRCDNNLSLQSIGNVLFDIMCLLQKQHCDNHAVIFLMLYNEYFVSRLYLPNSF